MQIRNSNQRRIILAVMKDNYSHPTADEIYEKARTMDPHISRGTVYRNLGILSESGQILKIAVPDGPDHYDCTLMQHYHFCCEKCGKMYDVPGNILLEAERVADDMAKSGFAVNAHSLLFTGLCPECNKN